MFFKEKHDIIYFVQEVRQKIINATPKLYKYSKQKIFTLKESDLSYFKYINVVLIYSNIRFFLNWIKVWENVIIHTIRSGVDGPI